MKIEKLSFYDEMKMTDISTFSRVWLQNLGTVWYSRIFDNLVPARTPGYQIKGILLYNESKMQGRRVWAGFICLRTGISGGIL